jgi:hypothetical protein
MKRIQTAAFLALVLAAQLLGSMHGVSHISGPDDQACSQCLQGKPKQPALPPLFAVPQVSRAEAAPAVPLASVVRSGTPLTTQPRAPPETS